MKRLGKYKANFLWPVVSGSVEEAGYEFVNGATEAYRKIWWRILMARLSERARNAQNKPKH
jgi:hypothetical protein